MLSSTENIIDGGTFIKMINGLNETIGIVLDYLQDAKVIMVVIWHKMFNVLSRY